MRVLEIEGGCEFELFTKYVLERFKFLIFLTQFAGFKSKKYEIQEYVFNLSAF